MDSNYKGYYNDLLKSVALMFTLVFTMYFIFNVVMKKRNVVNEYNNKFGKLEYWQNNKTSFTADYSAKNSWLNRQINEINKNTTSDIIDLINRVTNQHSIVIVSIDINKLNQKNEYNKLTLKLVLEGNYFDLINFIVNIENSIKPVFFNALEFEKSKNVNNLYLSGKIIFYANS